MARYNERWWETGNQRSRQDDSKKWYPNNADYEYSDRTSYNRYGQLDQPAYSWNKPFPSNTNRQYTEHWETNSAPYRRRGLLEHSTTITYPHLSYDEQRTSTPPYNPGGYTKPPPLLEQKTRFDTDDHFQWNSGGNFNNVNFNIQDTVNEKPKTPEPPLLGSEEDRKRKLAMTADRVKKCLKNFNNESNSPTQNSTNSDLPNEVSQEKSNYPETTHSYKSSDSINFNKITASNNQVYQNFIPNRQTITDNIRPSTPKEKVLAKNSRTEKKSEAQNNTVCIPQVRNNSSDRSKVESQASVDLRHTVQRSESQEPKINQTVKKSSTSTSVLKTQNEGSASTVNQKRKTHKPHRSSDTSNVNEQLSTSRKGNFSDQRKINDLKAQILRQLSTMSRTKLADLISNPHSQKFELAMKFLVKEHQSLVSVKQRNIAHAKIRNLNLGSETSTVNLEESVPLDPTASIDLGNLPQELVDHLSSLLNLDFSALAESGQHYNNDRLEVCPDDLKNLEEFAASLEEPKRQEGANYGQVHIKQEMPEIVDNAFDLTRVKTEHNASNSAYQFNNTFGNSQQYSHHANDNTGSAQYDFSNYQNVHFVPPNQHASYLPRVEASYNMHNSSVVGGYEDIVQPVNYDNSNYYESQDTSLGFETNVDSDVPPPPPPPIITNDEEDAISDFHDKNESDSDDRRKNHQRRTPFDKNSRKSHVKSNSDKGGRYTLNRDAFKGRDPKDNEFKRLNQEHQVLESHKISQRYTDDQITATLNEHKEGEPRNNMHGELDASNRQWQEVRKAREEHINEQSKTVSNERKDNEPKKNRQEEIEGPRRQWQEAKKTREENEQSKAVSNERKESERKNYHEETEESRRQWREARKTRQEHATEQSKTLPIERKEIEPKKNCQEEIGESRKQWREAKKAREEHANEQAKVTSSERKEPEPKKNYQEEIEESRRQWLEARKAREEQADEQSRKTQHEQITEESKKIRPDLKGGDVKKTWRENKRDDFKFAKKPDNAPAHSTVNDEKDSQKTLAKSSPLDSLYKNDKTSRFDSRFERNRSHLNKDYKHFSRDSSKDRWHADAESKRMKTYNSTDSSSYAKSYVDDSTSLSKINSDKPKSVENDKNQFKHAYPEPEYSSSRDENAEKQTSQHIDKEALSKPDIPANGCLINKKKLVENRPRESPIQMLARHEERVLEGTQEDAEKHTDSEPCSEVNTGSADTSLCTSNLNVEVGDLKTKSPPTLNDRDVQTEFAKQLDDKIMQTEPPNELDPSEIQMMLQLLERSSQLSPELAELLKNHFSSQKTDKVIVTQDARVPEDQNNGNQVISQSFCSNSSILNITEPVSMDVDMSDNTAIGSSAEILETDPEKIQVNKPAEPENAEDNAQVSSEIESMFLEMLRLDRQMQKLMARKLQLYLKLRVQIPPAIDSTEECDIAAQFEEIPKSNLTQPGTSGIICPPQLIISQQAKQSSHSVVGQVAVEIMSPVCDRDMFSSPTRQLSKVPEHFSPHPGYPGTSDLNPCVKVMDTSVVEAVLDTFTTPNSKVKDEGLEGESENLIHSQVMKLKTKSTQTDILGSMLIEGDCILMTDENNSVEIRRQHQRKICLSRSPLNTLNLSTDVQERGHENTSVTEKTANEKHRIYATLLQDESDTDSQERSMHLPDRLEQIETSTPLTASIEKKMTKKTLKNTKSKRSKTKSDDLSSEDEEPHESSSRTSARSVGKEDTIKTIGHPRKRSVSEVSEDMPPLEENEKKKKSNSQKKSILEVSEDVPPSEGKEVVRKKKNQPRKISISEVSEDMPLSERKEDTRKNKGHPRKRSVSEVSEDMPLSERKEDTRKNKSHSRKRSVSEVSEDMPLSERKEETRKNRGRPRKRSVSEVSEGTPLSEVKVHKRAKFIYDSEKEHEESNDSKISLENKSKPHSLQNKFSQKSFISESDTVSQDTVITDMDIKNSKNKKKKKKKNRKEKVEKTHESRSGTKKAGGKRRKKDFPDIILDSSSSDDENITKSLSMVSDRVKLTSNKLNKHTVPNKSNSSSSSKLSSPYEIKLCSVVVRRLSNNTLNKSRSKLHCSSSSEVSESVDSDNNKQIRDRSVSVLKTESGNESVHSDVVKGSRSSVIEGMSKQLESDKESVHSEVKKDDSSSIVENASKQSESDNENARSDVKREYTNYAVLESDNESVHSDVKKDDTSSVVEEASKLSESDNESVHSDVKKDDTSSIVEEASKQSESDNESVHSDVKGEDTNHSMSESDNESVHSDAKKDDTSSVVEEASKQSESDNESVHSGSVKGTNVVDDAIKRLESDNESVHSVDQHNVLQDDMTSIVEQSSKHDVSDIDSVHTDLDESHDDMQVVKGESHHSPKQISNQSDEGGNEVQCIEDTSNINFSGHDGTILDLKVYGNYLFAASDSGSVYCYSTKSNEVEKELEHGSGVTCLCVVSESNGEDLLFTGSLDCFLRCFSLKSHRRCHKPQRVDDEILCIDHNWGNVYAGTKSGMVAIYDVKKAELTETIKLCADSILCIRTTKEGARKVLISASRKSQVSVHDATNGLLLRTMFEKSAHTTYSLLLHSSLVYCGAASGTISVYEFTSGEQLFQMKAGGGVTCMRIYNDMLLAACYDGNVYVFSMEDKSLVTTIPGPGKMLLCMDFIKNQLIIGCKEGKKLVSWNLPAILEKALKEGH